MFLLQQHKKKKSKTALYLFYLVLAVDFTPRIYSSLLVVDSFVLPHHPVTFKRCPQTNTFLREAVDPLNGNSSPDIDGKLVEDDHIGDVGGNGNGNDNDNEQPRPTSTLTSLDILKCNTLPRLYVGETSNSLPTLNKESFSALNYKTKVRLSTDQTHYLTKVMRFFKEKKTEKVVTKIHSLTCTTVDGENIDINECVRLFDGLNGEWLAKIIDPSDSVYDVLQAECLIQLRCQHENDTSKQPWVIFSLIKKRRLKTLVETCTGLDTQLFCPIITDHTAASVGLYIDATDAQKNNLFVNDNKSKATEMDKLPLIACEAAEQSERLTVPTFVTSFDSTCESTEDDNRDESYKKDNQYWNIDKILESLDSSPLLAERTLLVCREGQHDTYPISQAFDIVKASKPVRGGVVLLIGPDGGWSERENALFDEYNVKYSDKVMMCVSLGSSVSRAETNAAAALALYALWVRVNVDNA